MKELTVDFTGVKYYLQFYRVIKDSLEFPEWFGENPDAVWELLTGYIEYPDVIHVKGGSTIPKDLNEEYVMFIEILAEAQVFYDDLWYDFDVER